MKWSLRSLGRLLVAAPLFLGACGGEGLSGEDLGELEQQLPAGSNAQFVSSTIPLAMNPGERLFVQTVMKNTGAASPANDWDSTYSLSRVSTAWSWISTAVTGTVAPNDDHTFSYVITAPSTPNTYTYTARMKQNVQFGATVSIPNIVVSNATQRQWDCTYVPGSSTIPTTMTPGENRVVTITVQNTGTQAWGSSGFYLKTQDTPAALWHNTSTALTTAVAPGATKTFNVAIKAPATPQTYAFKREMIDTNGTGIGFFDLKNPCVNVNIDVQGDTPLNASVTSEDFPTTMAPNESRVVTVVMKNTGTQTWTSDGSFGLYSKNTPSSLWGVTQRILTTSTAQGIDATLKLTITAPSTPGNYAHVWQMRKTTGADAGYFGQLINIPVVVDADAVAPFDAAVVSQTIPTRVTAGKTASFSITMQNTGSSAWTGSNFTLYSTNSPVGRWTRTSVPLGAAETVNPMANRVFTFNVTATSNPGIYDSRWQMRNATTINFFGEEAVTTGIEVTLCGNNVVDAGETCDDNNLTNGDGCSDVCQPEMKVVDLATDAADRTFTGSQTNRQLGTVAIGDVTGDGTADVVMGENASFGSPLRNQAGRIYGYSGGAGLLNGSSSVVTTSPTFTIEGAEALDGFGTYGSGAIVIGDVTGDAVADLIVSANTADGAMNGRDGAGEVYVFSGGASLTGTLDVAAAPAALTATLIGAHASDQLRVLAVADVTGDGTGDLILGAADDTNGTNAGAVYVVAGGAGIAGSIDMLTPSATVYTILGAAAGDVLGATVAVGDFDGIAGQDLLLGASQASGAAGQAYAIFGPIGSDYNLADAVGSATGPDVLWIGAGANDRLGSTVAAGNVAGSATGDVVISAIQQRKAGVQVGVANVWTGPLVSGTTYDLSTAGGQAAIIQGIDASDGLGSATRVGDWTGDGIMDIAVAANGGDGPTNGRSNAGELRILRGGAGITGTLDLGLSPGVVAFVAYGPSNGTQMGARQTTLAFGPIDTDGKADICVGSPVAANGRIDCFKAP